MRLYNQFCTFYAGVDLQARSTFAWLLPRRAFGLKDDIRGPRNCLARSRREAQSSENRSLVSERAGICRRYPGRSP